MLHKVLLAKEMERLKVINFLDSASDHDGSDIKMEDYSFNNNML